MSDGGRRPGFFENIINNIKQEMAKNKEMKESLSKFKQETSKLEQSDALKKARQKFDTIEAETKKSGTVLKKKFGDVRERLSETMEEVQKTEFMKKGKDITEEISKTAGKAAETISKQSQNIGQTSAFKNISKGVGVVKDEIASIPGAKTYIPPEILRKRSEKSSSRVEEKIIEPDDQSSGMVLHKDSKYYQSWQNFKDNNQYINKMFDLKMQYDESDNPVIRVSRNLTDKVGQVFSGMFSKTEMSEVLTEICKVDPKFDIHKFIKMCEVDIIPNILEAMIRGDLEILKDWCHEAPYNVLSQPITMARQAGLVYDSKILDLEDVDVITGKLMEQGPVLIINFHTMQIRLLRNSKGEIKEGDPKKVLKVTSVWALCRDQEELDPRAAWKLMDMSEHATSMLF
ncbi:hypothetical protein LOTGIDRAFT_127623 [Lottia gigantea]|uniref:Mitochondrial import inner membrane translocase subunit TIM44 n=1 Tax=Lottia gigantea TaxID=225164 RepID=V3ZTA5_LOTGI|nr:hypothetical protein LOTGIDRAFT_127623 [Lottia gigantea]ESO87597.1 hypothetical protein LOTGIDRAFT_127623 [Lottia gigantea]